MAIQVWLLTCWLRPMFKRWESFHYLYLLISGLQLNYIRHSQRLCKIFDDSVSCSHRKKLVLAAATDTNRMYCKKVTKGPHLREKWQSKISLSCGCRYDFLIGSLHLTCSLGSRKRSGLLGGITFIHSHPQNTKFFEKKTTQSHFLEYAPPEMSDTTVLRQFIRGS